MTLKYKVNDLIWNFETEVKITYQNHLLEAHLASKVS